MISLEDTVMRGASCRPGRTHPTSPHPGIHPPNRLDQRAARVVEHTKPSPCLSSLASPTTHTVTAQGHYFSSEDTCASPHSATSSSESSQSSDHEDDSDLEELSLGTLNEQQLRSKLHELESRKKCLDANYHHDLADIRTCSGVMFCLSLANPLKCE